MPRLETDEDILSAIQQYTLSILKDIGPINEDLFAETDALLVRARGIARILLSKEKGDLIAVTADYQNYKTNVYGRLQSLSGKNATARRFRVKRDLGYVEAILRVTKEILERTREETARATSASNF